MRKQDEGPIAEYVDTAASQVEQFANMLREQDLEQLMNTTAQFARRQPALFLGAAFALGFAATRFIKSSAPSGGQMARGPACGTSGRMGMARARIARATATGEP